MSTQFTNSDIVSNDNILPGEQTNIGDEAVNSLQSVYTDSFASPEGRNEIRQALEATDDEAYKAGALSYLPDVDVEDWYDDEQYIVQEDNQLRDDIVLDEQIFSGSSAQPETISNALAVDERLQYKLTAERELEATRQV